MKTLFYLLISALIILLFIAVIDTFEKHSKQLDISNYKNYIVIEKGNPSFGGYYFYISNKYTIKYVRIYQIVYEQYQLNDTIK